MFKINIWVRRISVFLLFSVMLLIGYGFWLHYYEFNSYPEEDNNFEFHLQRSEIAKQCLNVGKAVSNYVYISTDGRIDGHISFTTDCMEPNGTYAISLYVSNLQSFDKEKTGIFSTIHNEGIVSNNVTRSGNSLSFFLNSTGMKPYETYQLNFELTYGPSFFNKYFITMEDATISQVLFSFGKEYRCEGDCFVVFPSSNARPVVQSSLIRTQFRNESLVYLSKRFDVNDSRLTFRFSPKKSIMELASKVIDALAFGLAASVIYGAFIGPLMERSPLNIVLLRKRRIAPRPNKFKEMK